MTNEQADRLIEVLEKINDNLETIADQLDPKDGDKTFGDSLTYWLSQINSNMPE